MNMDLLQNLTTNSSNISFIAPISSTATPCDHWLTPATTGFHCDPPPESSSNLSPTQIISTICHAIIAIGGLIGNALLVCIISRASKMWTSTNILILNLAASDLANVLITIPLLNYLSYNSHRWPFGETACMYFQPLTETFPGVCVLTHTAVSMARYYIVRHPLNNQLHKSHAIVLVLVTWLFSYTVMSAMLMGPLGDMVFNQDQHGYGYCQTIFPSLFNEIIYQSLLLSLIYALPVAATGFAYMRMHIIVQASNLGMQHHVSIAQYTKRREQGRKMDRALMWMYFLFAVSTLPIQLIQLVQLIGYQIDSNLRSDLFMMFTVLFYLQVVSNPLVLLYMSREFRNELCNLPVFRKMFGRPSSIHRSNASKMSTASKFSVSTQHSVYSQHSGSSARGSNISSMTSSSSSSLRYPRRLLNTTQEPTIFEDENSCENENEKKNSTGSVLENEHHQKQHQQHAVNSKSEHKRSNSTRSNVSANSSSSNKTCQRSHFSAKTKLTEVNCNVDSGLNLTTSLLIRLSYDVEQTTCKAEDAIPEVVPDAEVEDDVFAEDVTADDSCVLLQETDLASDDGAESVSSIDDKVRMWKDQCALINAVDIANLNETNI